MESIYYVISWACHRRCEHCYDDRFRPYTHAARDAVVREALENFPRIIDHFPDRMTFRNLADPLPDGGYREAVGNIVLSGGEVLINPIRESVLYPALERLREKYRGAGGVKLIVQTTGDLLNERIIEELLGRGVWMIMVSGMDDYHVGMEGDKRAALHDRLVRWFEAAGMRESGIDTTERDWRHTDDEHTPVYSFLGATSDTWIGKLWPRGRAWANGLSTAGIEDNFCNAWSGGLGFLDYRHSGSQVSVEPTGDVYPCCMKTKRSLGNLTEEPLTGILDSLAGHPVYEAINAGHPERMGAAYGWDTGTFIDACETRTPLGDEYRNLCIGCDRFHEQVLGPVIEELRDRRRRARLATA